MATYNGHRSWNARNVSLWLNNDEALYREMLRYRRMYPTVDGAARALARMLEGDRTPDGARYNVTCIREAMRGLED